MTPPLQIDVSAPSVTGYQVVLAVILVGLVGLGLAIAGYRIQYAGLPTALEREKRTLLGQRETTSPASARIDESEFEAGDGIRGLLRELLNPERQGQAVDDRTTLGEAAHEARMAFALGYRGIADRFPSLSLYLLEEAALVLVLGSIAVESVDRFEGLFSGGGGAWLSPQALATGVMDATVGVGTTALDALLAFPYIDVVATLALTTGITIGTVLFEQWLVVVLLLILAAAILTVLDRQTPGLDLSIGVDRYRFGVLGIAALLAVWVIGVFPGLLFGAFGFPTVGAVLGVLLATVALCVIAGWVVRDLAVRLRALGRGGDWDRAAVATLLVRRWSQGLAFCTAPLIVAYLVVSIAEGKLVAVVGAFLAAPPAAQALVALVILAGVGLVAWQLRPAWPAFYAALRDLLSRRAIQIVLFRRAVPVSLVPLGYLLALGFGLPWWVALGVGLVLGVVTAVLVTLAQRARYQVALWGDGDPVGASRIVVHGYRFETTTGEPVYYATVNSVALAHEDPKALVDAICDVAAELFERGTADPSIERRFANDLFEYGVTDVAEVRQRTRKHVDEDLRGRLRKANGMAAVETIHDHLAEYPESVWRDELATKMRRGELRRRNDHYVLSG